MATINNTLATAALAGLISAGIVAAGVANAASPADGTAMVKLAKAEKEKHACKGLNSCKGQGADGKNACKGHGSCRTDGKTSE